MRLGAAERALVRLALREDLGRAGDLSTRLFLPPRARYRGRILFKSGGVLCGSALASEVFRLACPGARLRWLARDGRRVRPGAVVARLSGPRAVLTAERTALNFLQRMSGVATLARAYAERVRGTRARVYDTRKTLPGWRALDKYAVRVGGAMNHRMGLYDMVLLKDNHLAAWKASKTPPEPLRRRVRALARRGVPVEIEAKTHREVELACALGARLVLLDNMRGARLAREIRWIRREHPKVEVEVSGGVGLPEVRALARLGPDRISVGRLTHSAPAADLSLELEPA